MQPQQKTWGLLALVLIIALALTACGGGPSGATGGRKPCPGPRG